MQEWQNLTKGLRPDEMLSPDIVKGSKIYSENIEWITNIVQDGYSIIDLGESATPH